MTNESMVRTCHRFVVEVSDHAIPLINVSLMKWFALKVMADPYCKTAWISSGRFPSIDYENYLHDSQSFI